MCGKSSMETCITVCKIDRQQEFAYGSGNSDRGSVQPKGVGWGRKLEGASKGRGIYVYLWLIHFEV